MNFTWLSLGMISLIQRTKTFIRAYAYWLFAVIMGITLIILGNEEDIEPFFSITSFIYWSLLIFWGIRWLFFQIKSTLKQKKEKSHMELLHLQSQVNPHFFFNTLNNLYGLIDKDAKKAKSMVLTLSEMMRYSVYDGQKEWVTMEQELEYLKNYIGLHKARYHKDIDINLHQHIEEEGIKVMPLLFIILLENAFKHGVENLREDAYVRVSLIADSNEIIFAIENNFDADELSAEKGIGLKNLQRRLEIGYPKKHTLSCSSQNDVFKAKLTLNIK